MATNLDLSKSLQEDRERRLSLGLTDVRVKTYVDELWEGKSREEALAAATSGLKLCEDDRAYASECLAKLPGPGEV